MQKLVLNKKAIQDRTANTTVGAYRLNIKHRRDMRALGKFSMINPYNRRTRKMLLALREALDE
jgi:hypothetical protein